MPKTKRQIEPRDLRRLEAWASEGLDDKAIAGMFSMTFGDFRKSIKTTPRAEIRLLRGRARHQRYVVGRLHKILDSKSGSAVTAGIWLGKAVHSWTDKAPPPAPTQNNIVVYIPEALSPEAYRAKLEAEREVKEIASGD